MASKKASQEPSPIKLVHRFTPKGQHRLESHEPTKKPEIGDWASSKGIAVLGTYRGTTEYYAGVLPMVFKVTEVVANEVTD